jgi:L-histidine N-alpha-methyltransferase
MTPATAIETTAATAGFAADVRAGLSRSGQKELPSKYLYDELGSALFEAITYLPEYGVTRADQRVLEAARAEIVRLLPPRCAVAELGSGSGKKTRIILEALARRGKPLYMPIDVSAAALERCRSELNGSAAVVPLHAGYLDGLRKAAERRPPGAALLVLFLGSNIGNFDRAGAEEFLRGVRDCLLPGDALLVGADLEKPEEVLLRAYDDPTGVTAAFNLNLLARVNRELGADFALRSFRHEARYHHRFRRVEMHLRSLRDQQVRVPAAGFTCTFLRDETIWTEASHKFGAEELPAMAARTGFSYLAQWVDRAWPFAESLWMATG